MAYSSRYPILPLGLKGFPWTEYFVMWNYAPFDGALEIRIWHPLTPDMTAEAYWSASAKRHLEIWAWLQEHYELRGVPDFDMDGRGRFDPQTDEQVWKNLAIYSTFRLGETRKTRIS